MNLMELDANHSWLEHYNCFCLDTECHYSALTMSNAIFHTCNIPRRQLSEVIVTKPFVPKISARTPVVLSKTFF